MLTLEQKLAAKAAAKALEPAVAAANDVCASFERGDTSDAALTAFCAAIDAMRAHYFAAMSLTRVERGSITFERGKKNAKIVKDDGQRSVFCFVELETGHILKAAGWSAPAKGVRGNICNGSTQLTPHGAQYNR